jgi:hypothetical protein
MVIAVTINVRLIDSLSFRSSLSVVYSQAEEDQDI